MDLFLWLSFLDNKQSQSSVQIKGPRVNVFSDKKENTCPGCLDICLSQLAQVEAMGPRKLLETSILITCTFFVCVGERGLGRLGIFILVIWVDVGLCGVTFAWEFSFYLCGSMLVHMAIC